MKEYVELRALTWKQPFATLMLPPWNKIETRTWHTNYRGYVAIHAAKTPYSKKELDEISIFKNIEFGKDMPDTYGKIIAVGKLIDCRPMKPEDEHKCFVKYRPGLWCHVYANIRVLDKPIPFQGKQGWAKMNEGFIRQNIPLKIYMEKESDSYDPAQLNLFNL